MLLHTFCTLLLCFWLWLPQGVALGALPTPEIAQRMEYIRDQMQRVRFCFNDTCFFRKLTLKFTSPTEATVLAEIDRPAGAMVTDTGDYHFTFAEDRWRLTGGEEYTDVADYAYKGGNYDIYSVHSSRVVSGSLDSLSPTSGLKSGYLAIYNKVLFHGIERIGRL